MGQGILFAEQAATDFANGVRRQNRVTLSF